MSTFSRVYKPYTFWDPLPHPPKKSNHQIFLSGKNPHENNKNQTKKLKVKHVAIKCWFSHTHPPSPKVYVLYTCENVDIFGRPLTLMKNAPSYTKLDYSFCLYMRTPMESWLVYLLALTVLHLLECAWCSIPQYTSIFGNYDSIIHCIHTASPL